MKSDNPYFMAAVELQNVKYDVEKAIEFLEQNLPGAVVSKCSYIIKEALRTIELVHSQQLREARRCNPGECE